MVYYHLRERNNIETSIASNSIVQFETSLMSSKTNSLAPPEDFQDQEDGSIDIARSGIYLVLWYVSGMTGFATNGQSYKRKKLDYGAQPPGWIDLATASNHIKVSSSPGYSIVVVSEDEIYQHGKATIALFNTSDSTVQLTFFLPKATIAIFGIELELLVKEITAIEQRITTIEQEISYIFTEINRIERFVYISRITNIYSLTERLLGVGVSVMHIGFEHEFWGMGSLSQASTLVNGVTYYIITTAQYPQLRFYVLESTITTLWIETPGGTLYNFPVRFDESGIYFTPPSQLSNLPAGTTFKFTQTLLLIDPDELPHLFIEPRTTCLDQIESGSVV